MGKERCQLVASVEGAEEPNQLDSGTQPETSKLDTSSPTRMFKDVTSSITAATSTSLAVFLTGALAIQMRASLHFGADAFGLAISIYYVGAAIGSVPFGRLAEAVGGVRVMKPTAIAAAIIMIITALFVKSWLALVLILFIAGILSAAMQTSTNLFLARRIPGNRQGLAYGIKQAAIPFSALLGGLAVPGIALTVGWRWAFVGGAAVSVVAAIIVPKSHTTFASYRAKHKPVELANNLRPLIVMGVGFGLSVFAASGLTAFLVTSGVAGGLSKSSAGFVAGFAGGTALIMRVVSGFLADRRGKAHFKVVAGMLGVGVLGFLGLAIGSSSGIKWIFIAGAIIAFGAGWGWNGLFNYAVIRTHQNAPARATGITQVGGRLAGVFGPLVFGLIVAHGSFAYAWLLDGAACLVGAVIILYGRMMMLKMERMGLQS